MGMGGSGGAVRRSPLPSWEREGPIAKRWEGEGDFGSELPSALARRTPHPAGACRAVHLLPQGEKGSVGG